MIYFGNFNLNVPSYLRHNNNNNNKVPFQIKFKSQVICCGGGSALPKVEYRLTRSVAIHYSGILYVTYIYLQRSNACSVNGAVIFPISKLGIMGDNYHTP